MQQQQMCESRRGVQSLKPRNPGHYINIYIWEIMTHKQINNFCPVKRRADGSWGKKPVKNKYTSLVVVFKKTIHITSLCELTVVVHPDSIYSIRAPFIIIWVVSLSPVT